MKSVEQRYKELHKADRRRRINQRIRAARRDGVTVLADDRSEASKGFNTWIREALGVAVPVKDENDE